MQFYFRKLSSPIPSLCSPQNAWQDWRSPHKGIVKLVLLSGVQIAFKERVRFLLACYLHTHFSHAEQLVVEGILGV